jgi:Tol biopolymer transport system component
MGTAGYMSPEQVRGEDVDHRSDIFALGAIVYEMLARRRAFHAATSVETMNAILREDPPEIDSSTGRVPPAIDRLVRRCLEKNREERFHSAHDVAYALDVVSSGSGTSGQPALAARTRSWLAPLLVVAACAGCAALGFMIARRQSPPPSASVPPPPHFTQLTFDAGIETHASIAPDGKSFAYASVRNGNFDIYVQRIGGTNPVNLTATSPGLDAGPVFSPDGQLIAFSSSRDGEGLYVMGATGESVRRLTEFGFDPSWSPDGKRIVFANEGIRDPYVRARDSTLWIVDVATGTTRKIEGAGDAVQPSWSPNGTRIAYWCAEQGRRIIKTIPATGGKPTSIMTEVGFNWNPVWSADGKTLFFGSDRSGVLSLWRVAIDEASGATRGDAQPLTAGSEQEGFLSVARDGTTVFRRARGAGQIYEVPYDPKTRRIAGPPVALLGGSRSAMHVDLSPDRQWVVFASGGAQEDLFVARRDGSELRQITNDAARDRIPRWSPDGSRIAFYSSRAGDYDLWTIRPDGGDARQLTRGRHTFDPVWSPDGKFIALRTREGDAILVTVAGEPSVRPLVAAKDSFYPTSWTADGTRICGTRAVGSVAGPAGRALVFDVRTGQLDQVGDIVGWPVCVGNDTLLQQDGRNSEGFGRQVRLKAIDLRTKQVTDAGTLGSLYWRAGAVARDGRSIIAPSTVTETDIWLMRWPAERAVGAEQK